jgi:hypothetical protein
MRQACGIDPAETPKQSTATLLGLVLVASCVLTGGEGFQGGSALGGGVFGSSRASKGEKNEAAFQLGLRYALSSGLRLMSPQVEACAPSGASVHGTAGINWTIDIANHQKSRS